MWLKSKDLKKIGDWLFPVVLLILTVALVISAVSASFFTRSYSESAEKLSDFTYEIINGEGGAAVFPHTIENLAPQTIVTVYANINPGRYENLLVKTVYTKLKLYADDELIYECGGGHPSWMSDPPTLLKIVPLPDGTSRLRFEYISPSQRDIMSLPALYAGSTGALLAAVFKANVVLLVMSIFFIFLGLVVSVASIIYRHKDKIFLYLGLFALATGCWSFGECDASAFLVPYPVLLYLMSFGGLFTLPLPLLRYGRIILNPRNAAPILIAKAVMKSAVVAAFALQLTNIAAFSKTMYVFHVLIPSALIVFAATTAWEYFRYRNKMAKWFVLPTAVLAVASILEVVNYLLNFTSVLSSFFISGAFAFTLILGFIGIRFAYEKQRELEELNAKTDFYRKANHALRTPLTVISTNIQTARRRPEEAYELLTESQAEIMKMARMIDNVLQDDTKEASL